MMFFSITFRVSYNYRIINIFFFMIYVSIVSVTPDINWVMTVS
jgi:hypothetical protein